MYKVKTDLGSTWRRHVDQIKPSKIAEDIAQNTPLIEEPSVETTENTMTDVQTENINDKPIDGPRTITAVQERRYPERIRKQTKRLITEMLGSDYTVLRHNNPRIITFWGQTSEAFIFV